MKIFYPIISLTAYLLLAWQCAHAPRPDSLPASSDSIYTIEYIRNIYITEPQRALGLVDTAEKLKNISGLQADYFRYSIYNNKGMYHIANDYLQNAMKSDSMKTASPKMEVNIKSAFISLATRLSYFQQAMEAATELSEKARNKGNRRLESEMLYSIGMIYQAQLMFDEAEQYSTKAIQLLENSTDIREMAYLSYIYGMQMGVYEGRHELEKAIETGEKREKLIGKMSGMPGPPKGYIDEQYGFLYSKLAAIYQQDNQPDKAAEAFDKFRATRFSGSMIGKRDAIPYLLDSRQYKEAATTVPHNDSFGNDTINRDFIVLLRYHSRIAAGLGNHLSATDYINRITVIQDSLMALDKQNAAIELATIYETNEKNRQIEQQHTSIVRQRIILITSISLLLLSGLAIYLIVRHLRTIKQKNRFLATQIDSQLAYREELKKANAEIEQLRQQQEAAARKGKPVPVPATEEENEARTSALNKKLFDELEHLIEEKKLYLDPDISRDQLLKQLHITKNVFAQLIQTYNGTNFIDYLKNKRLEHSINLLKDYKGYTIEAVAMDSGFGNVRTFYRIFREKYGMTPSEYRNTLE